MRIPLLAVVMVFFVLIGAKRPYAISTQKNSPEYQLIKDWLQLPKNFPLSHISSVAVDISQNIVFFQRTNRQWTDPFPDSLISSNTVFIVDRNSGKIIDSWGANLFVMPHSITVDKENNIWVTDVALQQVFKFTHKGKLLMKIGIAKETGNDSIHFNLPTDVAVANDGSFYVSDGYENSRIVKFNKIGKYLFEWGRKGMGAGEFNIPHSISLDSQGNVFVADRENNRIQKFDANGKFLKEWQNNEGNKLFAITVDKKGNVFAVDGLYVNDSLPMARGVIKFTSNLAILMRFGRNDSSDSKDALFHDIAVDKEENIYVANIFGKTVQKFRKLAK